MSMTAALSMMAVRSSPLLVIIIIYKLKFWASGTPPFIDVGIELCPYHEALSYSFFSLCSFFGHQLVIPSHRLTTYGRRAFSVAGLMFWNSLPRNLRDPLHTAAVFGRSLKTFLFSEYILVYTVHQRHLRRCAT